MIAIGPDIHSSPHAGDSGSMPFASQPARTKSSAVSIEPRRHRRSSSMRRSTESAAHSPAWVINAAAYTAVDRAEQEPEAAERVNATAPRVIGEECGRLGIRVLHFSTDYVFGGAATRPLGEDDAPGPINVYGRTKLEGEQGLLGSGARATVVRTSWLFGAHGRCFPRTMWARARAGQATRVVDDQHGRPTCAADLARASWRLMDADVHGIVHASSSGPVTTWFDVAQVVFAHADAGSLLAACATADYPTAARRPVYTALDTTRFEGLVGALPTWMESLRRFLDTLDADDRTQPPA